MTNWILVFAFTVPNNANFNKPIIIDHFTTQQQCEITLAYIESNYREVNIKGNGYCWGVSE